MALSVSLDNGREDMGVKNINRTGMIMIKYIHIPSKANRNGSPLTSQPIGDANAFLPVDVHAGGDSHPIAEDSSR